MATQEPMDEKHPDWDDERRLRAQRVADRLRPHLKGLRFFPKPEDFFVWPKDLQEIVDLAKAGTETYVVGKPGVASDGILIARTDEAGNVTIEIE